MQAWDFRVARAFAIPTSAQDTCAKPSPESDEALATAGRTSGRLGAETPVAATEFRIAALIAAAGNLSRTTADRAGGTAGAMAPMAQSLFMRHRFLSADSTFHVHHRSKPERYVQYGMHVDQNKANKPPTEASLGGASSYLSFCVTQTFAPRPGQSTPGLASTGVPKISNPI